MATRLLRIVESKIIRKENNIKSLSGLPPLIFRNFIAENSKMLASSAAALIMNVPISMRITSSSKKFNAVS
jgi:hypothetical protein